MSRVEVVREMAARREMDNPAIAPPNPAREIRIMDSRMGMYSVMDEVVSAMVVFYVVGSCEGSLAEPSKFQVWREIIYFS